MTDKRGPKGAPIRVGDDFNDDEATVLDVSLDAVREAVRAREADERREQGAVVKKRAPPPSVADDDLEKTEIVERPDLGDLAPAAAPARGVVPLGADAVRLLGKTGRGDDNPPKTATYDVIRSDEAETVMLARPPRSDDDVDGLPLLQPEERSAPAVRALDDLTFASVEADASDDKTLSRPKIARMTFKKRDQPLIEDEPDGASAETRKRGIANAAGKPVLRPLPPPPAPKGRAPYTRPAPVEPAADDAVREDEDGD